MALGLALNTASAGASDELQNRPVCLGLSRGSVLDSRGSVCLGVRKPSASRARHPRVRRRALWADEIGDVVGPWPYQGFFANGVAAKCAGWKRSHAFRSAELHIVPSKIAIGRAAKPMNRTGGNYPVFNSQTTPCAKNATYGGKQGLSFKRRHMVHDVAQQDKIEGRGFVQSNVLDRSPQEPNLGSISMEEPTDPWGDVRTSHRGGRVSLAEPFGHRAFTAADFQYSARLRHPDLQAVYETRLDR